MADPKTPPEWMARAAEARSVAEGMRDPQARATMLGIAAGYDRLASRPKADVPSTSANIYRSSNGDSWRLISDAASGRRVVRHEPNPSSGGQVTTVTVEEFLAVNGSGPEFEALRRLLDSSGELTPEVDH